VDFAVASDASLLPSRFRDPANNATIEQASNSTEVVAYIQGNPLSGDTAGFLTEALPVTEVQLGCDLPQIHPLVGFWCAARRCTSLKASSTRRRPSPLTRGRRQASPSLTRTTWATSCTSMAGTATSPRTASPHPPTPVSSGALILLPCCAYCLILLLRSIQQRREIQWGKPQGRCVGLTACAPRASCVVFSQVPADPHCSDGRVGHCQHCAHDDPGCADCLHHRYAT